MHNAPAPSRRRRGRNRLTTGNATPSTEGNDTHPLSTPMSPDRRDLPDAGTSPSKSGAACPDFHLVRFSLEEAASLVGL